MSRQKYPVFHAYKWSNFLAWPHFHPVFTALHLLTWKATSSRNVDFLSMISTTVNVYAVCRDVKKICNKVSFWKLGCSGFICYLSFYVISSLKKKIIQSLHAHISSVLTPSFHVSRFLSSRKSSSGRCWGGAAGRRLLHRTGCHR